MHSHIVNKNYTHNRGKDCPCDVIPGSEQMEIQCFHLTGSEGKAWRGSLMILLFTSDIVHYLLLQVCVVGLRWSQKLLQSLDLCGMLGLKGGDGVSVVWLLLCQYRTEPCVYVCVCMCVRVCVYVCVFVCVRVYIDPRGFSQDFSVCIHVYSRATYATCRFDDPLPMDCRSQLPWSSWYLCRQTLHRKLEAKFWLTKIGAQRHITKTTGSTRNAVCRDSGTAMQCCKSHQLGGPLKPHGW